MQPVAPQKRNELGSGANAQPSQIGRFVGYMEREGERPKAPPTAIGSMAGEAVKSRKQDGSGRSFPNRLKRHWTPLAPANCLKSLVNFGGNLMGNDRIKGRGRSLIRISLPWAIDCVSAFQKVNALSEATPPLDAYLAVLAATTRLTELFNNSIYVPHLKVSSQQGAAFRASLDAALKSMNSGNAQFSLVSLQSGQLSTLRYAASQFLNVLTSELGVVPTFLVLSKEGYDVTVLTDSGHKLFPPAAIAKVPESERDMVEAGRALAFELPTACGFHVFRVLESVIKRYWDQVSGQQRRPSLETIGNYAKELQSKGYGEAKVWETLAQIAKLHRNPLIHPEVILSVEEAITTIGIARSAIGAMLAVLPDVLPTTAHFPHEP